MKRNVMFAVYYVGCAPTVFIPPAAGCLPSAMQPVAVVGLLLHYLFCHYRNLDCLVATVGILYVEDIDTVVQSSYLHLSVVAGSVACASCAAGEVGEIDAGNAVV